MIKRWWWEQLQRGCRDEAKPLRDRQEFPLCSLEQELAPLLFKSFYCGNDLKFTIPQGTAWGEEEREAAGAGAKRPR